jgi:hypothetical protein
VSRLAGNRVSHVDAVNGSPGISGAASVRQRGKPLSRSPTP